MRTAKRAANPVGQFVGPQQPVELDDSPFAMNPLGLYGVQPRALLRKKATDDPHSLATLLDSAVVFSEPSPHLPGDVPARVVPDQKKGLSCPVPRVPRSTTRGIASLWNSRADHRRTSATCRRVGAGRVRNRIWPSARGRPWRPTVGSCEGARPPRRRRSKWAAPPGSTSIRPKSRWPTEGRRRLSPSVGR